MDKGIIFYTDNCLDEEIAEVVRALLSISGLPVVSCSLKPLYFGENILVEGERCYFTMARQITAALEKSQADYVFFCEHDVLYPQSHFDFTPPNDNVFYYNENVWRWEYPKDRAITYQRLISLSGLCVNRLFALEHYKKRLEAIGRLKESERTLRDPNWARKWGYEPGTKKKKRGGFSNDNFDTWRSEIPLIDIRHGDTFSPSKVDLKSFRHLPEGWRETSIDKIEGWNLKKLFNL